MRTALRPIVLILAVSACDGVAPSGGSGGGSAAGNGAGGANGAGGGIAGGSATGGGDAGGATAGGDAGGSAAGGSAAGGSTAGGSTAGGSTAGGSTAGGSAAGGSAAGGAAAGGSATGGGSIVVTDGGLGYAARPPNPTCIAPPRPVINSGVQIVRAFPNITFASPIAMTQGTGDPSRILILEKAGRVRAFPNQATVMTGQISTVLDVAARVDNTQSEGGALGLALHPQWTTRKELFLSYTRAGRGSGVPLVSVISRFRSNDNGVTFDPASEERLLQLDQPFTNHNGGNIAFGPDGFLYIGFGDGGSGDDPNNAGQSLNTNHGKILRIDVNVPFVGGVGYAIPLTNPFAATGQACNQTTQSRQIDAGTITRCSEIWALGLRNPWRFSFDQSSGVLWAGDVGQGAFEEIDIITAGGNYGWRTCEGFTNRGGTPTADGGCSLVGRVDPVVAYGRTLGFSVTGGHVYRGTTVPALVGRYVFGDYGSGRVWYVDENVSTGERSMVQIADTNLSIGSFGQTLDGEVFIIDLVAGTLSRFTNQTPTDAGAPFPATLSATGCFTSSMQPVAGLIPYDLISPLWSDGATKERFFAIPDATTITVLPDGDFTFPNGTVTAKTFSIAGQKIETRLLVRHSDGLWAGYSYEWRDDQTDADLLPAGKSKVVGSQTWQYPSRGECMTCHTAIANRTLGPEIAQLNRTLAYPSGVTSNQLETLAGLGFLSAPLSNITANLPRLESPSGTGPLDLRARSYLHSNCSNCHRNQAVQGPHDLRYSLPFRNTNTCGVAPTNGNLGVAGSLIVAPADPSRSIISLRMHALNSSRMPPLGSSVVDTQGTALIDAWINSITTCP
jgi:uncharacterized repeat protein (TIGR03806 family)